jgi:hypothetical protein
MRLLMDCGDDLVQGDGLICNDGRKSPRKSVWRAKFSVCRCSGAVNVPKVPDCPRFEEFLSGASSRGGVGEDLARSVVIRTSE